MKNNRMKKSLFILLIIVALTCFAAACGSPEESPAPAGDSGQADNTVYTFTCGNLYASTNGNSIIVEQWIKEIEQRSEGRIQIDYFPGSSLVSDAGSYEGVQNGVVDIAMTDLASGNPGVFDALTFALLPQGYSDGYVATHVLNDYIAEYDLPELDNIQVLYMHCVPPLAILTNAYIENADDVWNGLIIRSGSDIATSLVTALGAQAYSCSIAEVYEAFAKGIVDGAITGTDTLSGFNFAEVVKYVLRDGSFGKVSGISMIMNKNKFAALPEDLQQIITEVSQEYVEVHARYWQYTSNTDLDKFLALGDAREVILLSDEVQESFAALTKPAIDALISGLSLTGGQTAEYAAYIQERIAYWQENTPSSDDIYAWYDENLSALMQ